jgi:hypothetical protein
MTSATVENGQCGQPILSSFNPNQVLDGSMGLDEPQNHSVLGKFSMKVYEHPGIRQIYRRRSLNPVPPVRI